MLGRSRLHGTAGNRAEEACALEHGGHNRTGDAGADLKAERAAAEMYSCAIRGKENIEWVEVSEEETIDLDELEDMFPDDFCGV